MDENDMKKKFFFNTKSPAYRRALEDCERVAASNVNVLLIGESGSGKDVAAQYIHACSRRSDMPLIAVNCNAYTESLLKQNCSAMNRARLQAPSREGLENSSWLIRVPCS